MKSLFPLVMSLFLVFVDSISLPTLGHPQSIAVHGLLKCNGKPMPDVKVKLYDDDAGVDLDDLMAEGHTDAKGTFRLNGTESEVTTIDPKVNVYHDCEDRNRECLRKFSVFLPKDFVTQGPTALKTFDMGTINLEGIMPGETRDCLN